jgi:DNA modification methylase
MISSLHHATLIDDSTMVSIANADYVLVFRRSGKNKVPVNHPHGLINYAGSTEVPGELLQWKGWKGDQIKNAYSQWIWRQYASCNWHDIRIDNTLGGGASIYSNNRAEKEVDDEKHMHPLQLDVIERCVTLWSNPGETVLTPFLGIGSEVYQSVRMGRRGIGIELKDAYFRQAVKYVAEAAAGPLVEEVAEKEPDASLFSLAVK